MNNKIILLFLTIVLTNCSSTDSEWKSLIADNSLEGWHIFQDDGSKKGWIVEDRTLIFNGVSDMESGEGDASLLSDKVYGNFEIKFDWKIIPGGNSGFMWGVREDEKYNYPYQTGPEIQILDPAIYDNPNIALGGEIEVNNAIEDLITHKHFVGALYDLSAPEKTNVARPSEQWNSYHIKIDYKANRGEVILNDVLINSFPLEGPEWDAMVLNSKFSRPEDAEYLGDARWFDYGKFSKGHICFQDHPGMVSFRNIKIRELDNYIAADKSLPNILFIPVDDLRPDIGAYGDEYIKTPNMDRLARQGVTFDRAYCQQAVCNPSRASLLTGLRPDSIQVWDLRTDFRDNVPDVVTLPQFFKQHGYTTIGLGKAFHNNDPDTISWSITPENINGFPFDPDAVYANEENLAIQQEKIEQLKAEGKSRIDQLGHWYVKANATENADVDDDAYYDGAQTTRAIEILQELKSESKPFFLSVGYYRPHLPFNAPKKYWDLYNRSEIPLAENQYIPEGSPAYLVHGEAELRGYSDCHNLPLPGEAAWDEDRQREIKHGYYASVSYTDAQIGRLLDELERLGLAENTLVVLWGDHGWKLGEHNGWCKQTNYEIDTRVPLIISGARVSAKGRHTNALTEFVDIYPTLCALANFAVPEHLQGISLVPLLENPDLEWKTAAYSQFLLGRFGRTKTVEGEQMGYTIRTDRYRYVEWYNWIKEDKMAGDLLSKELFDHQIDPQENKNIAADPAHREIVEALSQQLKKGWRYSKPNIQQTASNE